jgi:hypothetical protein
LLVRWWCYLLSLGILTSPLLFFLYLPGLPITTNDRFCEHPSPSASMWWRQSRANYEHPPNLTIGRVPGTPYGFTSLWSLGWAQPEGDLYLDCQLYDTTAVERCLLAILGLRVLQYCFLLEPRRPTEPAPRLRTPEGRRVFKRRPANSSVLTDPNLGFGST